VVPRKLFDEIHDWRPDIIHIHGEYNAENLFVPSHCHVLREFFYWDRVAREHLAEYERIRGEYRSGQ